MKNWLKIALVSIMVCAMLVPVRATAMYGSIAGYQDVRDVIITENTLPDLPWYIEKVQADAVWKTTSGGKDILVAVLDTGIDVKHEDLAGKVIESVNFTASKTADDLNGHGTVTAGIITASIENLKGATGIAYRSLLLNVKVAGDNGIVYPEAVAKGIVWAADKGAQVINLSLTLNQPSAEVEEAVRYAWDKGAVIIAAAGNTASVKPVYPAASPNVIGVAATDKNDRLAKWSNRGDWVSVSAPGVEMLSTIPQDKYAIKSGTSYATALVSGEAALLLAVARDRNANGRTNDEVRDAILRNTDVRLDGAYAGRVNLEKAVAALLNNR